MVKQVAKDRPLSFEEVGVVGADAVQSDVQAPREDAIARQESRPADASKVEGDTAHYASGFDRVEDDEEAQEQRLPEGYLEWPSFKQANNAARENFVNVVLFPEFEFIAPGRYVDARDTTKIFDVMPGEVSPKGLFLFPANYLNVQERDRVVLGRDVPAGAPPAQARHVEPNPLRRKGE